MTLVDCGAGAHLASLRAGLAVHGVEVNDPRHVLLTHDLTTAARPAPWWRRPPPAGVGAARRAPRHHPRPDRRLATGLRRPLRAPVGRDAAGAGGQRAPDRRGRALPLAREVEAFAAPRPPARGVVRHGRWHGLRRRRRRCGAGRAPLPGAAQAADVDVEARLRPLDPSRRAGRPASHSATSACSRIRPSRCSSSARRCCAVRSGWPRALACLAARAGRFLAPPSATRGVGLRRGAGHLIAYAGLRRWWRSASRAPRDLRVTTWASSTSA